MSHTLMSLDAEWRRLARASRARRALKQWSIAHPARRGLADLDELLERRRDDRAAPAILRALAVLAPGDELAAPGMRRPDSARGCRRIGKPACRPTDAIGGSVLRAAARHGLDAPAPQALVEGICAGER